MGAQLPRKWGGAQHPQFWPIYCGQTAAWIKMPLGTGVGLGPGHIVLHGDPALPKRGTAVSPQFSAHVCCGQTAGWINMSFGTEVDLGPGHIVLDGAQIPPPGKRHSSPRFQPMSIMAKRWPISATAELLSVITWKINSE